MAITRQKKEELIASLVEKLKNAKSVVFTDYRGLTVEEMDEVRNKLRAEDVELKVVKNTLFKIASNEAGIVLSDNATHNHPFAVAFRMNDEVTPAKITFEYSKKNEKFAIVGGVLEGREISENMVKSLASLPTKEQLYGQLVSTIAAPLSGLANVLEGNIRGLVNVLSAVKDQK